MPLRHNTSFVLEISHNTANEPASANDQFFCSVKLNCSSIPRYNERHAGVVPRELNFTVKFQLVPFSSDMIFLRKKVGLANTASVAGWPTASSCHWTSCQNDLPYYIQHGHICNVTRLENSKAQISDGCLRASPNSNSKNSRRFVGIQ